MKWRERFFHLIDPDGHELSFAMTPSKSTIVCLISMR
jgi:hypothetical protein